MRLGVNSSVIRLRSVLLSCLLMLLLNACGGGSSGSSGIKNPVTVSGTVTYDFVPYHRDYVGLDYTAIEVRPVRGAVVELVDRRNRAVATTFTNDEGFYTATVEAGSVLRVQVKAQLKRDAAPAWNFTVNDNTDGNRLYALIGSEANVGNGNSQRNLHAPSGWYEGTYAESRPAAPFAILDTIYTGLQQFVQAGYRGNFRALEVRWSVKNNGANGDLSRGEIGTSFYEDGAIYLLGEADQDTDEFDTHVIVHEWAHYIEDNLARSDSIGGSHEYGDYLDMRVAFSEGFGNAFAAMMLDDPIYRDSSGFNQSYSFMYDVSETNHSVRGWYSESSIESVLYNYFISSNNKTAKDFSPFLTTLTDSSYYNAESLVSIFLFAERLVARYPGHRDLFESLLYEQDINSTSQYGEGEINSGNNEINLPVYKSLSLGRPLNVCSTSSNGGYNKLGVNQFMRLSITQSGNYAVRVERMGGDFVRQSDPDLYIYQRGILVEKGDSNTDNVELGTVSLQSGNYIVEVTDYALTGSSSNATTCFNVLVSRQ